MKNNNDIFIQYCKEHLDFTIELSDEYGYGHLPLCVIDSVFSIGVRYSSVQNTIARFCSYFGIEPFGQKGNNAMTISQLLEKFEEIGVENMALEVFHNKQRTSTRSGILKADAVYQIAKTLAQFQVEKIEDLPEIIGNHQFEKEIKQIPGQGSGITLRYFYMLAGEENYIKPNRMIHRFTQTAIGKKLNDDEVTHLLQKACSKLISEFPWINPRHLDHMIWKFQRTQ